jgi:hypothetical protein
LHVCRQRYPTGVLVWRVVALTVEEPYVAALDVPSEQLDQIVGEIEYSLAAVLGWA